MPTDRLGIDIDTPVGQRAVLDLYRRLGPDALKPSAADLLVTLGNRRTHEFNKLAHITPDRFNTDVFDSSD